MTARWWAREHTRKIPDGFEDATWPDLGRAFYHFAAAIFWLGVLALSEVAWCIYYRTIDGLKGEGVRRW